MFNEFQYKWVTETAASSGGLTAAKVLGRVERFTFNFWTDAGCTATVQMQAGASETGPWTSWYDLPSTNFNLSTSALGVHQVAGPIAWLRPYITAKSTGVLTIEAFGN